MVLYDDLVSIFMGIMETIKNNKGPVGIAAVAGLGILGWLAFGFFGIQAAFIDDVVDEDGPVFAAPAAEVEQAAGEDGFEPEAADSEAANEPQTAAAEADAGGDGGPDASAAAAIEEGAEEPAPEGVALVDEVVEEVVEEAPAEGPVEEAPVEEEAPAEEAPTEETVEAAAPAEEPAPEPVEQAPAEEPAEEENQPGEIVTLASGTFSSLPGYTTSGDALVLNNGTEQRFLRFENFATDNGPDLKVYLRADNGDFISLGDLSGNIGDQNYEIPVDVDLDVFSNVEIWCERFARGFGVATLAA